MEQMKKALARSIDFLLIVPLFLSGIVHMSNPYQFANSIAAYELVPDFMLLWIPKLLSSLMITISLYFMAGLSLQIARISAATLFALFGVVQLQAWLAGAQHGCGCFGFSSAPISGVSVSIPIILFFLAITSSILGWLPLGNRVRWGAEAEEASHGVFVNNQF